MRIQDEGAIDALIQEARDKWENVGLAVAVVAGEDVIYLRGSGRRQAGEPEQVDGDTLFQVGSTSKAFTAAALGILVQEGRVQWDDPVVKHLPSLQLHDSMLTQTLTIRDALIHCSGIGDRRYHPFVAIMDASAAIDELRYVAPEAPFRDSYRYNNLLYALAGRVIEAATGMSWGAFVERRILKPLVMTRSGVSPYRFWDAKHVAPTIFGSAPAGACHMRDARDGNVAMPHGWDAVGRICVMPWRSYDNAAAAGALVSSARDMANWLILNLNGGRFGGNAVLEGGVLRNLHASQNPHVDFHQFPFEEAGESYAYGWRRTLFHGTPYLAHGGGMIGFPAYMSILPERKLGVVVLSNGSKHARECLGVYKLALHKVIAFSLLERLMSVPWRDWNREFKDRARAAEEEIARREEELGGARRSQGPPLLALHCYAGVYEDERSHTGRVCIADAEGGLKLNFAGEGAFSALLEHWHRDVFRLRMAPGVSDILDPQFVTFDTEAAKRVVSMSVFDARFQRVDCIA